MRCQGTLGQRQQAYPRTASNLADYNFFLYCGNGWAALFHALCEMIDSDPSVTLHSLALTHRMSYMALFLADFDNRVRVLERIPETLWPALLNPDDIVDPYFRILFMFDLPPSELPRLRIGRLNEELP